MLALVSRSGLARGTRPGGHRKLALLIMVGVWWALPTSSAHAGPWTRSLGGYYAKLSAGLYLWNWFGKGGASDGGYSPRNKPSGQVLAHWYKGSRPTAAAPAPAAKSEAN